MGIQVFHDDPNGHIDLVESWGSDEQVIEAARMSTGKGFDGWGGDPCPECHKAGRLDPEDHLFANEACRIFAADNCVCKGTGKTVGDEKLLRYLWENKHHTPFEMCGATFVVQAPICVFREWHRHRTQSYNELSARYTPLPDVNYLPTLHRVKLNHRVSGGNKQAGAMATLAGDPELEAWIDALRLVYKQAQDVYTLGLSLGVPKELARLPCPVGRYSRMRASANLRNWFHFLELRMAPNAMWEIRQYAHAVCFTLASVFPRSMSLFLESTPRG